MNHHSEAVLKERAPLRDGRQPLHRTARLYFGYLALCLVCLSVSVVAVAMRAFLPRMHSKRLGRKLIAASFRAYLRMLVLIGACRFDLSELDLLRAGPAVIVAPNHPCLLDAIMILSRLPEAGCIMKAELVNNVFFGVGARLAAYTRSTPLRSMIHLAVDDLRQGSHLLLFPEGTRTRRFPIGDLQGTTALISKHAGVAVQTVFIETDSTFLGKGWSLFWTPDMPITYRVRLGKRFDPPADTALFTRELKEYFDVQLAHAPMPLNLAILPPA